MMGEKDVALPPLWTWTLLGTLASLIRNGVSAKPNADTGVRVLRISSVRPGKIDLNDVRYLANDGPDLDRFTVCEGDILFTRYNGTRELVGVAAVASHVPHRTLHPDKLIKVRVPRELCEPKFLAWSANVGVSREFINGRIRTTAGQAGISGGDLRDLPLPLAPLSEQRRIAEALDSYLTRLDETTTLLERVQRNLKRYRASVLKAAVEGRLVPTEAELARAEKRDYEPASVLLERILVERRKQWEKEGRRGKYKEPELPDTKGLSAPPEGWCWANLAVLKAFSLYGPRFTSEAYVSEGKLVLRTSDISASGKVNFATAPRLALAPEEFRKYAAKIGDLLITRTGSLGTLAVFNDDVDAVPGAYLIQYRLRAPLIASWYCFYFFKSPAGQNCLRDGGAGVGRPNLNAPTIEKACFALPPLAEQERIVAEVERRLSIAEELQLQATADQARCSRLRQSILKWAFEGKLVDQDPNDEPASALLARIKAEPPTPTPHRAKKNA